MTTPKPSIHDLGADFEARIPQPEGSVQSRLFSTEARAKAWIKEQTGGKPAAAPEPETVEEEGPALDKMTKAELVAIAEAEGVEVKPKASKATIAAAIDEARG